MRLTALLAAAAMMAPAAFAQQPYSPQRIAGHPDLGGVWGTAFITPLERPPGVDLVIQPDKTAAFTAEFLSHIPAVIDPDFQVQGITALARVRGELRTSMLVEPKDGQLPFTPKAEKIAQQSFDREETWFDGPEDRTTFDRCLAGMGQAPIRQLPGFIPTMIVHTPDSIALVTEDVGSLRVVNLDRPAPPDAVRTFEGWSAGHWEGETLVVETSHSRADDPVRGALGRPILVGSNSKVIERFTRLSHDELLYQFTVEDADLYTRPWLGEYVFALSDKPWYEYACHEGNQSMVNMLVAGRMGRQPKRK
jgi:hypothetical protein